MLWANSRNRPIATRTDLVRFHCDEWGYFSLAELQAARNRMGLGIERDLYFEPGARAEVLARD